jgi:hypothetical protein
MVPAIARSRSAIPLSLIPSASSSYDISTPSHSAIAALLARSVSTFASALATSHLPTKASLTQPAPTPHTTAASPRTTSWYRVPNARGTWQLLITCLITINLCVWTAVHLNIPEKLDKGLPLRERIWKNYYCRRARWVLLGLLAPELVVYTAWMQWESARVFKLVANKYMNGNAQNGAVMSQKPKNENTETIHAESDVALDDLHDEHQRSVPPEKAVTSGESHEMTMKHGFYAGMGSYYIDLGVLDDPGPSRLSQPLMQDPDGCSNGRGSHQDQGDEQQHTPEHPATMKESAASSEGRRNPKRLYLTARGVLALVKASKLSLPSKEAIADRSKSDVLAKTLVCLQAGYIIVQCVSRLASGLPLTFLEINTLGHVLCALIMYSFWAHKPQDLGLSIALDADLSRLLGNWHCSCRDIKDWYSICHLYEIIWERTTTARSSKTLDSQGPPTASIPNSALPSRQTSVFQGYPTESDLAKLNGDDCVLILQAVLLDRSLGEVTNQIRSWDVLNIFTAVYYVDRKEIRPEYVYESPRVRLTKIYSAQFEQFESAIRQLLDTNTEPFEYDSLHLQEGVPNWPSSGLLSSHTFLPPVAIAISTALYGGLHAAAWHSFFPTEVEMWFWRVSSIIIAGSGLLFAYGLVASSLWGIVHPGKYQSFARAHARMFEWVLQVTLIVVDDWPWNSRFAKTYVVCLGTLSVVSRLFLVVESFISLRKVPIEVYQTPNWTQWIPHL